MGEDLKNTAGNKEFRLGPGLARLMGIHPEFQMGWAKTLVGACFIGVVFGHLGGVKWPCSHNRLRPYLHVLRMTAT